MKILVTGCAGFIGFSLCSSLFSKKVNIIGIDNLNKYYDVKLKLDRLSFLKKKSIKEKNFFKFKKIDICNKSKIYNLFKKEKFDYVIHLAAQAGVRYSLKKPGEYIKNNIMGFVNLLEACKKYSIKHFVYASSSSVYGSNMKLPYSENQKTDFPLQIYAATKKADELIAHAYSHLYKIPTTGLRLFTVYGPWGRPDMAIYQFTEKILTNKKIYLYNSGKHKRDFTYIDDVIRFIKKIYKIIPNKKNVKKKINNAHSSFFSIYNLGNSSSIEINKIISYLEKMLRRKALKINSPRQAEDVLSTFSDSSKLSKITGLKFKRDYKYGIRKFILWYKKYYDIL